MIIYPTNTTPRKITVTPEMAAAWLKKRNTHNRTIRVLAVERYISDMKSGRWRLIGNPISFDESGTLLDGQHRLAAVAQSGIACEFFVVAGLSDDPGTWLSIDAGVPRAQADNMHRQFGIAQASAVVAIINFLGRTESCRKFRMCDDDLHATIERHRAGYTYMLENVWTCGDGERGAGYARKCFPAYSGAALFVFAEIFPAKAQAFVDEFKGGNIRCPAILTFQRNIFEWKRGAGSFATLDLFYRTSGMLLAFLEGKQTSNLYAIPAQWDKLRKLSTPQWEL
jgi:hypothetical protein